MTKPVSRRFFLGSVASLMALPACANAPDRSLRPVGRGEDLRKRALAPADDLIAKANLGGSADTGFAVVDTRTGEVLEARAASDSQPPASVAKALTAAYALSVLGPAHTFRTRLIATGGVSGGVVAGDLILAGGGDPDLQTDHLAELAARLKAAGIREVRGGFKVWGGALPSVPEIDRSQPDHVGYNPAISGLNLNFNRVHFEWRRASGAWSVTMDGRSDNYRPDVAFATMQIIARDAPVYTYADRGGRDVWTVAQGALGNGGARWLPVRKPQLYAGEVFRTFAGAQGIRLGAPQVTAGLPSGTEVAAHDSAPMRILLRDMLRFSTNLTAEVVGMAATAKRAGRVSGIKASAQAMNAWAAEALGVRGIALVDHSGLGDASRISPTQMTQALIAAHRKMGLKPILKDVPLRNAQGKIDRNHPLDVRAKTGTLNFVSALSGFVDTPDGRELAFTIFSADTRRRAGLSEAERERPSGAASWNRRAKTLQQDLLERWGVLYGS